MEVDTNLNVVSKNGQLLSRIENFENFEVNASVNISFTGSADAESFIGTDQADHFRGGGGNDIYTGGLGKDSFYLTQTETSIITITDFEGGSEGDILVFDSTLQITSNTSNIEFVDTTLLGKKCLIVQTTF